MASTVERLFTRQVPKSITGSELMFKKSATPMTGEDVLFMLGQIQHREPVGALVLDAQIAMSKAARMRLVSAIQAMLSHSGKPNDLAHAIAEAAVHEVVDTCVCDKCKGTGYVLNRKLAKMVECKLCEGVGRYILDDARLLKSINQRLSEPLSKQDWSRKHYDDYMDIVDSLHRHAKFAALCARDLLDSVVD